jgi:hypothetical protein
VERDQTDPSFARCDVLDAYWQMPEDARGGVQLRLSADSEGRDLWLTPGEAEQREADGRQRETEARQRAEARNRELEAEIEKLRRR